MRLDLLLIVKKLSTKLEVPHFSPKIRWTTILRTRSPTYVMLHSEVQAILHYERLFKLTSWMMISMRSLTYEQQLCRLNRFPLRDVDCVGISLSFKSENSGWSSHRLWMKYLSHFLKNMRKCFLIRLALYWNLPNPFKEFDSLHIQCNISLYPKILSAKIHTWVSCCVLYALLPLNRLNWFILYFFSPAVFRICGSLVSPTFVSS